MESYRIEELGSAVLHWLSFQHLCGRSALLSESYLSQPIGEFLLHHHNGTMESEVAHPNLQNPSGKGRPRQIDFCLFSRDKGRMTTAFELKWVLSKGAQNQAIIDDILRLEALRISEGQHVYRYLLVAGMKDDFTSNIKRVQANVGGGQGRVQFFSEFLGFKEGSPKTVEIEKLSAPQRAACEEFAQYYGVGIPRRFITEKIGGKSIRGFTVYIWRIRSAKSRRLSLQATPKQLRSSGTPEQIRYMKIE